jgi:anti-sigma28 factor (negative regulator of flagellin synthesis)
LGAGRAEPGEEEGRQAHVDALRRRVETGTYRIDADAVARAMLLEIAAGGV